MTGLKLEGKLHVGSYIKYICSSEHSAEWSGYKDIGREASRTSIDFLTLQRTSAMRQWSR